MNSFPSILPLCVVSGTLLLAFCYFAVSGLFSPLFIVCPGLSTPQYIGALFRVRPRVISSTAARVFEYVSCKFRVISSTLLRYFGYVSVFFPFIICTRLNYIKLFLNKEFKFIFLNREEKRVLYVSL